MGLGGAGKLELGGPVPKAGGTVPKRGTAWTVPWLGLKLRLGSQLCDIRPVTHFSGLYSPVCETRMVIKMYLERLSMGIISRFSDKCLLRSTEPSYLRDSLPPAPVGYTELSVL